MRRNLSKRLLRKYPGSQVKARKARLGNARLGLAQQSRQGISWLVTHWWCRIRQGSYVTERIGKVTSGMSWQSGHVRAWHGIVRTGEFWRCQSLLGLDRQSRQSGLAKVSDGLVGARRAEAVMARR